MDNPSDSKYCKECATPLPFPADLSATKTLETPAKGLALGSTFAGRYQIVEELGKGGMGAVYKALDTQINEEVAIKLIRPEIASDEKILERFSNELKLARKIAHKNVCKMYHLEKGEETPYISMEYLEGKDLKKLIWEKEKLSAEEAIKIAQQVCEGLAEAHRLGVVHRDLKPQNIMIDKDGQAKIMDFGIARSVEAPGLTQTGVIIGTPDYISPEQAESQEADERADIYSFGVIMYEMVTGSVPFKGDTALSVALKHKAQLPIDPRKSNPEILDDLSRLILICMEKDRNRRYQTAKDLLDDLRNIEHGLPLGTKLRPHRQTFVSSLIRNKLFIPALMAILAIIAVAIWQLLPQKELSPATREKPSVAIMYFKNNTGDEGLDYLREVIPDMMVRDLSQSRFINVLSSQELMEILSDLDQLEATSYPSSVLSEVAERGAVNHIIQGYYVKSGDGLRIDMSIQKAGTGEQIGTESVERPNLESIPGMVDELTRKIKLNFGLTSEEIADDLDEELRDVTTSSLQAWMLFMEAHKHFSNSEYKESIRLFLQALEYDPKFATVFYYLSWAYQNSYSFPEAKKYAKIAFEMKDSVSEREGYWIRYTYYFQLGQLDEAIEELEKLLGIYPDDINRIDLGLRYMNIGEWDKAIYHLEYLLERGKTEWAEFYQELVRAYRIVGLYDKAENVARQYLEKAQNPNKVWAHRRLSDLYARGGRLDEAFAELDKAFPDGPRSSRYLGEKGNFYIYVGNLEGAEENFRVLLQSEEKWSQLGGSGGMAAVHVIKGQYQKALDDANEVLTLAQSIGNKAKANERIAYQSQAYIHMRLGDFDKALEQNEKAGPGSNYDIFKVKYLAALERFEDAERFAEEKKAELEKTYNKKSIRFYYLMMGFIEMKKENYPEAIDYLEQAKALMPDENRYTGFYLEPLAHAYYKEGRLDEAQEVCDRISGFTEGKLNYGDIWPRSYYMLGKILEQKGEKERAIQNYDRFLELWKDADPGLPEVEDARERLADLQIQ